MPTRRKQSGFTLIELIVVMLIMTILLAMLAPNLRNWTRLTRVRNDAEKFIAVARYLHSQSVLDARVYRIVATQNGYELTVQQGLTFVPYTSPYGQYFGMSPHVLVTFANEALRDDHGICFYPDGRTDPARVVFQILNEGTGDPLTYVVDCPSRAELFRLTAIQ